MMAEHVKPYNQEENKKAQISKMFNSIAPYYDFLNRFLSLGIDTIWRKKAINALKADNPQLILDVATGTADLAIESAKRLSPTKITGIDISTDMLAIGRKKVEKKGMTTKIELLEGDSLDLPFEDNVFDAITVAFGVRNYENLDKGMKEMNRVLKPEGKLVVLEFSRPTVFPLKQGFNFYFKNILPIIGRITSKDPKAYSYLYESVQAFPDGKDFVNVMERTGFKDGTAKSMTFGICSLYIGKK